MLKEKILYRLQQINQLHLVAGLDDLSQEQQEKFFNTLSLELFKSQQERLKWTETSSTLEPIYDAEAASEVWKPLGIHRISQGKVACLILAGGQGSRLGSSLPKALVPVTPDGKKTLLELHLEKISAACTLYQTQIPCAILTSPDNHEQIFHFLKERHFCTLNEHLVTLVMQTEAPFLDERGNWILRGAGRLASGPDGNGHALHLLTSNGVLSQWKQHGIEEITIVPIDNPLADPTDPILIGSHAAKSANVTVKVIRRSHAEEKVGVLVRREGVVAVQEYSELPPQLHLQTSPQAPLAYIGLFALNLSFAEKVSKYPFPWHLARKQDPLTGQWIWKFERFIFDLLPYSNKTHLVLYPRENVYSPLKNREGDKSLATVQAALRSCL